MKYILGEIKYQLNKALVSDDSLILKSLREYGIYIIENYIDKPTCEDTINEINKLILNKSISYTDDLNSDYRIFGFENLVSQFKGLFDSSDYIFANYIGQEKPISFLMANKVLFKEGNKGSGGGWHRDSLNRRQLKFMVYLNNVDEKNGPFEYLERSHLLSSKLKTNHFLYKKVRYTTEEVELFKIKWASKLILGKAGTCVIFDSSGLHRGSPIISGERYALTKYMFEDDVPDHINKLVFQKTI